MFDKEYLRLKKEEINTRFNGIDEALNQIKKEKEEAIHLYEVELTRLQGEYRLVHEMEIELEEPVEEPAGELTE